MDFNRSALRRAPAWAPKRAPQARQLLALLAIDYNRAKTRKLGLTKHGLRNATLSDAHEEAAIRAFRLA
jgi:hypothetical protein